MMMIIQRVSLRCKEVLILRMEESILSAARYVAMIICLEMLGFSLLLLTNHLATYTTVKY